MAQQTALEWLFEQIPFEWSSSKAAFEALQQAKAMEKEQIEDAFHAGKWNGYEYAKGESEIKDAAIYYNETYGK